MRPRDNYPIWATHDRSIYIRDGLTPLQQWKAGGKCGPCAGQVKTVISQPGPGVFPAISEEYPPTA